MALKHASLHQLKIFHAVARHGSFARAAQTLHLSPPTLSLQVKQLADSVGQPLFEQIGKRIYLTPAGEAVARAYADIDSRLEALRQDLAALQGIERGSLKLAILTSTKYVVPQLLARFCAAHPGIEVALHVGNRESLLQRLAGNQDDLYIMGQPPAHLQVASELFAENPLVAIAPPGHPLVKQRRLSPRRLAAEPFILREPGSGTRLTTEAFFAALGVSLRNRLEVASTEAIKQAVTGGLGLAVVSASTVASELALGTLGELDVEGFPLVRHWYVVYPQGKRLTPVAAAFKEHLLRHRTETAFARRRADGATAAQRTPGSRTRQRRRPA